MIKILRTEAVSLLTQSLLLLNEKLSDWEYKQYASLRDRGKPFLIFFRRKLSEVQANEEIEKNPWSTIRQLRFMTKYYEEMLDRASHSRLIHFPITSIDYEQLNLYCGTTNQ